MFERAGRGLGHHVGQSRRAALRDDDGVGAGGMRGANDGAQIVRILDAIEEHEQARAARDVLEAAIFLRRAQRHHALMRGACRPAGRARAAARSAAGSSAAAPGR